MGSFVLAVVAVWSSVTPIELDVPFFAQDSIAGGTRLCGGAAAAMVQRYDGDLAAAPEDFAPLVDPRREGIVTRDLVDALRERGWTARPAGRRLVALTAHLRRGRPVMVLLGTASSFHYVIVVGFEGTRVIVHDPADGPRRRVAIATFVDAWDASDRWAIVVERSASNTRPPSPGTTSASPPPAPTTAVDTAVALARRGRLDEAERQLEQHVGLRPREARAWSELAALRLRRDEVDAAIRAAETACRLAPRDTLARRLHGAALFMAGRTGDALAAWNRIGSPGVGFVDVRGGRHTRYSVYERALGVSRRELLTPSGWERASRRVDALPAVTASRITPRVQPDGRVRLDVHVLERTSQPGAKSLLASNSVRWIADRSLRFEVSHLFGLGDSWSIAARTQQQRPAVSFAVAIPGFPRPGWVARLEGTREHETVRTDVIGIEHRRQTARLAFDSWITSWLRWEFDVDRVVSDQEGRHRGLGTGLEARLGRFGARAGSRTWWGDHGGRAFARADVDLDWTSGAIDRSGPRWTSRIGFVHTDRDAPVWAWPGAGVGIAREPLLRAHPLLDDGVLAGAALSSTMLHGGAEAQWWFDPWRTTRPGVAVFVDAADPRGRRARAAMVDAGVGLRLRLPGDLGRLCVDQAFGLRDDARAVSVSLRR